MGNLIPLQRAVSTRIFKSEWTHQLRAIEQSVDFFQEYFLWASQQLTEYQNGEGGTSPKFEAFFAEEAPAVFKEAREAIRSMQILVRADDETAG